MGGPTGHRKPVRGLRHLVAIPRCRRDLGARCDLQLEFRAGVCDPLAGPVRTTRSAALTPEGFRSRAARGEGSCSSAAPPRSEERTDKTIEPDEHPGMKAPRAT